VSNVPAAAIGWIEKSVAAECRAGASCSATAVGMAASSGYRREHTVRRAAGHLGYLNRLPDRQAETGGFQSEARP